MLVPWKVWFHFCHLACLTRDPHLLVFQFFFGNSFSNQKLFNALLVPENGHLFWSKGSMKHSRWYMYIDIVSTYYVYIYICNYIYYVYIIKYMYPTWSRKKGKLLSKFNRNLLTWLSQFSYIYFKIGTKGMHEAELSYSKSHANTRSAEKLVDLGLLNSHQHF